MEPTIEHNIVLNSLKVLAGIAGSTLDWFSYLSGRILSVRTSKFASNPLTCGVPQGSVLGSFYMLPLAGIIPSLNAIFDHFCGEVFTVFTVLDKSSLLCL